IKSIEDYFKIVSGITLNEYYFIRNFFNQYAVPCIYLRYINLKKSYENIKQTIKFNEFPVNISDFYKEKDLSSESEPIYLYSEIKMSIKEEPGQIELTELGIKDKRDLIFSFMIEDWKKLEWTYFSDISKIYPDNLDKSFIKELGIFYPQIGDLILIPPFEHLDYKVFQEIDSLFISSNLTNINVDMLKNYKLYISPFYLTRPVYYITDLSLPKSLGSKFSPPLVITGTATLIPYDNTNKKLIKIIFAKKINEK
ncbi:MAG: hypothetical protein QXO40_04335, partial [Candidatus Aenigmatarchaeota archaeon]